MRLFVSIDFPKDVCEELASRVAHLKGWKPVPTDQIHLTLYFLGNCTAEEQNQIIENLNQIHFQPFSLELNDFGVFPNQRKPQILWCGIRNEYEIIDLQQKIASVLYRFKKKPEEKRYIPHITLARRKKKFGTNDDINHLLKTEHPVISTRINQFLLKESTLKPEGREHKVQENFPA